MMPIAPLMIEHRLIEKMVDLLSAELERLKAGGGIDLDFNRAAVDFFRFYADQMHHGKEEQILFRGLRSKDLSAEYRALMEELEKEHVLAREKVGALLGAKTNQEAIDCLSQLVALYPPHIAKEDKEFFVPVMEYFNDKEKAALLQEGEAFDKTMIHKKYEAVIEELDKKLTMADREKELEV